MDDFEDLLLGGDIDTVNDVIARSAAMQISEATQPAIDAVAMPESGELPIPEDVYPKVKPILQYAHIFS